MRVACKRLREGMKLFCKVYRKGPFELAIQRVDNLNDHLGVVRDADVMVEHLHLFDKLSEPCAALATVFRHAVAGERVLALAELQPVLDSIEDDRFPGWLGSIFKDQRRGRKHAVAGQPLRRFARNTIGLRLDRVMRRLQAVQGEEDAIGLHRVRVANKHLRYAIEPFVELFDRRLQVAYRRVVELHGALGDLHDLDVLAETIQRLSRHDGDRPTAQVMLAKLDDWRGREVGRILTFLDADGQTAYVRGIADAID